MKIYFTTSARGDKELLESSLLIHSTLEKLGHQLSDYFLDDMDKEKIYSSNDEEKQGRYLSSLSHVKNADVVVLEVSTHSLTMGYLLNFSLSHSKPIILLHKRDCRPVFAEGIESSKLQIWEYSNSDILLVLEEALETAKNDKIIRFNLIIKPEHFHFLQEKSKETGLSKSSIIRQLIQNQIPPTYPSPKK